MANTNEKPVSTSTEQPKILLKRQLTGTTFLTLEHVGYFILVTLMPAVLTVGFLVALGLWTHRNDEFIISITAMIGPQFAAPDTAGAIFVVATLIVLAPLMYCLHRRLQGEYVKRPGYVGRVAYKLPVYGALGLLSAATLGVAVCMLYVFLNSLVSIGVQGVNVGEMYLNQFLPALVGGVLFGVSAWYVLHFAKGKDLSRRFVGVMSLLATAMVAALFVTALTVNHSPRDNGRDERSPIQIQPYPLQNGTYGL